MKEIKPFSKKVWLSSPTMHGDELKYMEEAYNTNWMSTVGANINEVEKIVCEKTGSKYAVALSSGTSALHLAIKLAGIKAGDRVFCSDLTFIATVNPVLYEHATPIFIDTEYDTWNMDPDMLEKAFLLYPDVKLVVVANLYGTPAKLDKIKEICKKHNAILVEDAAESLGATYKGKQTGTFGDYNCISFNGNKIITGSSGGMLLTDSKEAAEKAKKWSTQAKENVNWYEHTMIGYNYRMSNVIAGVVRGQLNYLEEHIALKKAIYERYKEGFKDLPIQMNPIDLVNSEPNYWLSCMIINSDVDVTPQCLLEALNNINAEGRHLWKPMHLQPLFKDNIFVSNEDSDVGTDLFKRGICLPSDIKMTIDEQEIIIETIKSCF
ncbi:MAG: aminotransferase class I/II-fold pyridoxal phosphate-dependent enzyme [Bacilli bacterium]|nr:aminotransferase class I/II-fold pyridoxal phosphate-dependent enzyme [Bacilli bacterium]